MELIQSRFFAKDFAGLGITGLQVTRVTRIHNRCPPAPAARRGRDHGGLPPPARVAECGGGGRGRGRATGARFLRNRFEEKLEETVDVTDSGYKKSLEYLFFGPRPPSPPPLPVRRC